MHLDTPGFLPALRERLWRPSTLIILAAGLLAADPLRWLLGTWTDATYNPEGLWVALAVAGLALWSATSARRRDTPDTERALWLLMIAAAIRATGQLLRVNVLGALTLAVDVYALATLAGLAQRRRAVSPGWLAALFALSLPLERVLQRVVGYGLQQLSATGACTALGVLDFEVVCKGTRILLDGQDLLVDLPCSGARGLILLLTLYCAACALVRPDLFRAARGFVLTLAAAWAANVVRLVLLALGLARGVPVMDAPWHEAIGLGTLALGALPVLGWARHARRAEHFEFTAPIGARPLCDRSLSARSRGLPFLFLAAALAIVNLPARPVDVSRAMPSPALPAALGEWTRNPQPLSAAEQAYFTRYGGAAARAGYGPHGLLLVSTAAPLRHLHAPDECLRNSGHDVRYVGVRHGALPTAIYRSVDGDGRPWRVSVSYVASDGAWATSVAEAVWLWLRAARAPAPTWTLVQRIAPWDLPDAEVAAWDAAVARALDLPLQSATEETFHRI